MSSLIRLAIIASLSVVQNATFAADIGWSVETGLGRTDNATSVEENRVDDTLVAYGGAIEIQHSSRRVNLSLEGQGSQIDYLDDNGVDGFVGTARGTAVLGIIPERFTWLVRDQFGQITRNIFAADSANNRENVNTFSTGPDILLFTSSNVDFRVGGRFEDTRSGDIALINEERVSGTAQILRQFSQKSNFGLVVETTQVKFDLENIPDYDQHDAFARFESELARTTWSLDAGASRVRVRTTNSSITNPLVRLDLSRRVAPSLTVTLSGGSEFQSTGQRLIRDPASQSPTAALVVIAGSPSETTYGSVGFSFKRSQTSISTSVFYMQDHFPDDPTIDRHHWSYTFNGDHRLTSAINAFVEAVYDQYNYVNTDASRVRANIGISWQMGRRLFSGIGYRLKIEDDPSNFNEYRENLTYLTLAYRYGTAPDAGTFRF